MLDIFYKFKNKNKFGYNIFNDYYELIDFLDSSYKSITVYYIYDYQKHDYIYNFSLIKE